LVQFGNLAKTNQSAQSLATHATDFDLWLACYTQEEIAEAVGCSQSEVDRHFTQNGTFANLGKSDQSLATHATDFDLWLACYTQEEIAEAVGITQGEVAKNIPNGNLAEWNKSDQSLAAHATDFDTTIYRPDFRRNGKAAETS